jgi:hypothetical protein
MENYRMKKLFMGIVSALLCVCAFAATPSMSVKQATTVQLGGYPDGQSWDYYGRYNAQTPAERAGLFTLTCSGTIYNGYAAKDGTIWRFEADGGLDMTVTPTSNNFASPVCQDITGPVFTSEYSSVPARSQNNAYLSTPFNWIVTPYLWGAHITP